MVFSQCHFQVSLINVEWSIMEVHFPPRHFSAQNASSRNQSWPSTSLYHHSFSLSRRRCAFLPLSLSLNERPLGSSWECVICLTIIDASRGITPGVSNVRHELSWQIRRRFVARGKSNQMLVIGNSKLCGKAERAWERRKNWEKVKMQSNKFNASTWKQRQLMKQ